MSDRSLSVASTSPPAPGAAGIGPFVARFKGVLAALGLMSGLINLLYLTGSFFMLQVYDRVIPSRSLPTLVALSGLALILYGFQAVLEFIRGRILVRMAGSLDVELTDAAFGIVTRLPLRYRATGDGQQPLRDLDTLRNFLVGTGLPAFFDLPWMPIYLFICFLFHPLIGWSVVVGAVILAAVALATELWTREPVRRMSGLASRRSALAEAGRRNAEVVHAMGMAPGLSRLWGDINGQYMTHQQLTSDVGGGLGSLSKVTRTVLQSGVLALGAYLVIEGQATGGIIIASSILTARALAPVALAIANWRGFITARASFKRLSEALNAIPVRPAQTPLPAPKTGAFTKARAERASSAAARAWVRGSRRASGPAPRAPRGSYAGGGPQWPRSLGLTCLSSSGTFRSGLSIR